MRNILSATLFLITFTLHAQQDQCLVFDKTEYDFGKIHEEKGKVEAIFYFTNMSKTTVKIEDVHASCGCTATDYTTGDILPNHGGYVKAIFDPTFRTGIFSKSITVRNNNFPSLNMLVIRGDVIPRPKGPNEWYPTLLGLTRFSTNHFAFNEMNTHQIDTVEVKCYNTWDKPIEITSISGPSYIKFIPSATKIKPNEAISIKAILDGRKVDDLGFIFEQGQMFTTDSAAPEKILYVSFTLSQYFAKLSKKDSIAAPHIALAKTKHDFGEIFEGEEVSTEFNFTNTGKKDLKILKTKASCGCTAIEPSKSLLKAGESATIKVIFNSKGREGVENKTITVITNDPYYSNQTLTIKAMVKHRE